MSFTIKESDIDPGSLCSSCQSSILVENQRGGLIRHCRTLERDLPHPVKTCTAYNQKGRPSIYEMKQIAWLIEAPKTYAGFVPPKDRRDRKKPEATWDPVTSDIDYGPDDD